MILFLLSFFNLIDVVLNLSLPPTKGVKKLLQVGRAGRDIEKVLQRYLFGQTAQDEKLQSDSLFGDACYPSLPKNRNCKTLEIFLSDRLSQFFHTFPALRGIQCWESNE
jgi:hypothetical protein